MKKTNILLVAALITMVSSINSLDGMRKVSYVYGKGTNLEIRSDRKLTKRGLLRKQIEKVSREIREIEEETNLFNAFSTGFNQANQIIKGFSSNRIRRLKISDSSNNLIEAFTQKSSSNQIFLMAAFIETAQKVHKNEPNKNRETFISLGKFLFYSLVKNSIDNISKDFSETFCFEELKEKSTKELMRLQEQRKSLRKELSDLEKPPKPRTKPTPKIKHQFKKPSKKFMDLRKKFEKK